MPSMQTPLKELYARMRKALAAIGAVDADPVLRESQDEKFGDYQSNCAMSLARRMGKKPRELAEALVEKLDVAEVCEPVEIAGPGFLNFRVKPAYLAKALGAIPAAEPSKTDRVGIEPSARPVVVAVDLSSPNLAKEMHVGHLRSTVIGDCICRILEFEGHTVHRENHVGDWGTQFGMLVAYLRRIRPEVAARPEELVIRDLETFYVEAKALFDEDEAFRKEARETVVALQKGDPGTRKIWRAFCDESLRHCHEIYRLLNVRLDDRGESYYTTLMDEVIERIEATRRRHDAGDRPTDDAWYVAESDGALCVFLEGYVTREGTPLPLIVRKADGGFNYATSDLATIVHRVEQLGAKRIVYVVGLPQKQHFEMVFAASRKLGLVGPEVSLEHVGFGSMLAPTGRPFKTREGGTVKLKDLLDEAVNRARQVVGASALDVGEEGEPMDEARRQGIAETVGLAAVKYFDLSHAITSDYKFEVDTMLSLEGNTAPYMLYAYARVRSIGRKAGVAWESLGADAPLMLQHPAEVALAKRLIQFAEVIEQVTQELRPNLLTEYLYGLSRTFSRFYDRKLGVRVVDAAPETTRRSRLRLCDLTARTLKLGLHLLGIETLERM